MSTYLRNILDRLAALEAKAEPPDPMPITSAAMWIDPGRMGGDICLSGTRITIDTIARQVEAEGIDQFLYSYDLDASRRRDVLVCCAYFVINDYPDDIPHGWTEWAARTLRNHDNPQDPPSP